MKRYLLFATLFLPALAALAFVVVQPITVLPRIALAPGFALTDQHGNLLTSEDLRGHIVLYHFSYASCTARCKPSNAALQTLQAQLDGLAADMPTPVEITTISFDERDDAAALARYADALGARGSRWHLLHGEARRLKQIIGGGFRTYYSREADNSFTFDPVFVLVDGWGIQRAVYRTAAPPLDILQRDINLLIQEAEHSKGATRYAYEAAHLFLCYP